MGLRNVLRLLAHVLTALPVEIAAAIWRLVQIVVLLLLMLLRFLKEIGEKVLGDKRPERPPPNHCCEVPPHIPPWQSQVAVFHWTTPPGGEKWARRDKRCHAAPVSGG